MSLADRIHDLYVSSVKTPWGFMHDMASAALIPDEWADIRDRFMVSDLRRKVEEGDFPRRETREVEVAGPPSTQQAAAQRRGDIEIVEDTPQVEPVGDNLLGPITEAVSAATSTFADTILAPVGRHLARTEELKRQQDASLRARLGRESIFDLVPGGDALGDTDRALNVATAEQGDLLDFLQASERIYSEAGHLAATAASIRSSFIDPDDETGLLDLYSLDNAREHYRRVESTSPGQAFAKLSHRAVAKALPGTDVPTDEELAEWINTPFGQVASGALDATARFFTDPTVLAGKGAIAARRAVRPIIFSSDDLAKVIESGAPQRFADDVAGMAPADIRRTYFSKMSEARGAEMSDVLASIPDRKARAEAVKVMLGDDGAYRRILDEHSELAARLDRLEGVREAVGALPDTLPGVRPDAPLRVRNTGQAVRKIEAEIDELYPLEQRKARMRSVFGQMRQVPEERTTAKLSQSEWYRESSWAAPLRTVFDMRPIAPDLGDLQESAIQLERQLLGADKRVRRIFNRARRQGHLDDPDAVPSGLLQEERDDLLNRLMASSTRQDRKAIFTEADDLVMQRMARAAGLTDREADELVGALRRRLGRQDLTYNESMAFDVEGRGVQTFTDNRGVTHQIPKPLHPTQRVRSHFPLDTDEAAKALDPIFNTIRRYRTGRGLEGLGDLITEGLDDFYSYWKFTRLARFGYVFGVLPDEQLRAVEELGMMSYLKTQGRALREAPRQLRDRLRGTEPTPAGQRPFRHGPYELEGPLGGPGAARSMMEQKIDSKGAMREFVGIDRSSGLRQSLSRGRPRMVTPDERVYPDQWEHVVNNQIAQNPMARRLLRGDSIDDTVRWLRNSEEGRVLVRQMDHRKNDLDRWVEEVKGQIDQYIPDDGLQRLAADRRVRFADLNRVLPNLSDRPNIHGDFVEQLLGTSLRSRAINGITSRLGDAILSWPTNVLSRHRFADGIYRRELRRLIDLADPERVGTLDDRALNDLQENARRHAAALTNERMYRIVERSDFTEAVRWFGPFFQAFQEVGNQWTRATIRNPAFAARLRLGWYAPERAGWVTDRDGNPIEGPEEGDIIGELANEMFGGDLDGKFINIKLPEEYNLVKDIPGARTLGEMLEDGFRWDKGSLSIATSFPFTGPAVSVPVAGLVGDKPEWDSVVRRFFPFGVEPTFMEELQRQILPPVGEQARRMFDPEDDRVELATKMRIYVDEVVRHNLGERDEYPSWSEVEERAEKYQAIHLAAKWFGRGSYHRMSPYQPIIDSYHQMRERFFDDPVAWRQQTGYEHPVEWFIDEHGEEYEPLTVSLTDSIDAVPPTDGGVEAFQEYENLIREFPQWGGVIVGEVGGDFNRTMWEWQLRQPAEEIAGAETEERRRNVLDEAGIRDAPMEKEGWRKYQQLSDWTDVKLAERGLSNIQQAGAEDIAEFRRTKIEEIREETTIPETGRSPWFEAFDQRGSSVGRGEWLAGMHTIAEDERLTKRPDIQGLQDFVELWDWTVGQLNRDERPQTLDAAGNADLREFWNEKVGELVQRNLPFSNIYHRMLEGREPEARDAELLERGTEATR